SLEETRIELDGVFEFLYCLVETTREGEHESPGRVRLRHGRRQFQRLFAGAFRAGEVLFIRAIPLEQSAIDCRQAAPSWPITRIQPDSAFEHFAASPQVALRHQVKVMTPPEIVFVGYSP